ncbi:synaptic vesicle glycoprotein 2B-like isoform X1 [Vespa velutina]|uniref:synaptic vesicle glycoprotein 2B-like isoform X1 n=1 Tax=Vespa velutina TaxID=202808 RepID=UPI001FB2356C|nr:synaptic vesicle glycoprotein 2B-like isoform X1 [Vespa velutina]XP_047361450.1 synaptic vesicle glycoprotein 2B-like isoform X1 [Vespa velutina]XP_047361451.1 synaptic vesicle glycoprotein 2B-like isoform X1 [Vespa velutina]XP_047361452.1 synaptic vesicle glycoprotein 2B-like isoform X1 [Vespa velutina]XP_047361453.1 synaptic vesicle glycoprotein 2B-like isoform X1 [Vespa velutina]XP_047361454.1 synaptic vesicle glycoprotein 2B-like isoform X1 [Vespa velutina]XP_047361455.1 synaptic vesic
MVKETSEEDKISTITGNVNVDEPAEYERAISVTGFGLFNVLLFMAALPIAWTGAFDTTSPAFILASAECDLQLTFFRKGLLIAFPFIAMLATASLWDYVTIYVGRRTLFVLGLLADSILNILSTAVDSYHVFLLIKFISGVIAGGPPSMVMGYLTEFHSATYKPRFAAWSGFLFSMATIVPAALGFTILPLEWVVDVFGKSYNSWRIYLLLCSIPPVLGLVTASMLPESPKHLMEIGRQDEALKLFRRMYTMNTRKPADTFSIKALVVQKTQLSRPTLRASLEKMRIDLYNTKLLFSAPYLPAFSYVTFLQFGSMLGFNTMRLWVPHMFMILSNYDYEHWKPVGRAPTICEMLDRHAAKPGRLYLNNTNFDDACFEWKINPVVYQNSTIIASSAVLFGFLMGFLMTTRLRKQMILFAAFLISLASSFGINWAQAPPYMLTLAAAVIVTSRIASNVVNSVNADVIPIPLRATSMSIITSSGNLGVALGNVIFSALLDFECLAGFLGLGCFFIICIIITFLYPKPVRASPQSLA